MHYKAADWPCNNCDKSFALLDYRLQLYTNFRVSPTNKSVHSLCRQKTSKRRQPQIKSGLDMTACIIPAVLRGVPPALSGPVLSEIPKGLSIYAIRPILDQHELRF